MTFRFARIFEKYVIKTVEHFFLVYIALSKHSGWGMGGGGWENSRKLCKPSTTRHNPTIRVLSELERLSMTFTAKGKRQK